MASKKESRGMGSCDCGRVGDGYGFVICRLDAPIPYELTDRGRRDVRRMTQWQAIEPMLKESAKARQALTRAAMNAGRKIERRARPPKERS